MKLLIAALLSVAIFWLAPIKATPTLGKNINNKIQVKTTEKVVIESKSEKPIKTKVEVLKPKSKSKSVEISTTHPNGCSAYDSIFAKYSWNVRVAEAICMAESGGRVNALSSTHDRGLMQINSVHAGLVNGNLSELYNPYTNIRVAYAVYVSSGWRAWTTYKTGAYLKYY